MTMYPDSTQGELHTVFGKLTYTKSFMKQLISDIVAIATNLALQHSFYPLPYSTQDELRAVYEELAKTKE